MARRLRFCFLSIFYPPYGFGGDAIFVSRLANALARRGHEVDVIHCVDSYMTLAKEEPEEQFANHPNVTVHSLRSRLGSLSPLIAQQTGRTWPKTDSILAVFYSKKFDVIHYHNISLFGPKVLQLEPDYRDFIKLYTTHEHWLVCPMHMLWKNNERVCDKPDCLRCTLKFRRPPQLWRYTGLLERCVGSVDAFVSPSLFTQRMHHERGFMPEMTVAPHFVPESDPGATSIRPSPHSRPYFLYVGRLEKIKGVETLLADYRGCETADLLIVGTGTLDAKLRRQAEGMANVRFLGSLPQERLRDFYHHAIALVVPSAGYEVLPLVILEAYLQRTPVIARDMGVFTEVVEHSKGGFLYRTGDELRTAMERLRQDPQLRQQMGEFGYQAYREKWTEDVHLAAYFRLLEDIAQRKWGGVPWHVSPRLSLQFDAVLQPE